MILDKEFFKEALQSVRKRKRTMFLTGMGVFGAIFLLILLMAAGNGLENGVYNRFKNVRTNCLYFYPGTAELKFHEPGANRPLSFNYYDFLAVQKVFTGRADVITCRYSTNAIKNISSQGNGTTCYFAAVDSKSNFTRPVNITEGNFISEQDCMNREKVILIGKGIKSDLFSTDKVVGEYVLLDNVYYRVAGVFESEKEGEAARYDDNTVMIPITVYHSLYNNTDISSIETVCNNDQQYLSLKSAVPDILKEIKHVDISDQRAINVSDTKRDFSKYISLFKNIRIFLWFVSLSMLLLGLMNISNVVMITVKERMKEIGIRKSMGATPADIKGMVILEAAFLTLVSGLSGLLLGYAVVRLIAWLMTKFNLNSEFFMHPYINLAVVFSAILILIIAGVVAGLIPAAKASAIKPIEVLRHE